MAARAARRHELRILDLERHLLEADQLVRLALEQPAERCPLDVRLLERPIGEEEGHIEIVDCRLSIVDLFWNWRHSIQQLPDRRLPDFHPAGAESNDRTSGRWSEPYSSRSVRQFCMSAGSKDVKRKSNLRK